MKRLAVTAAVLALSSGVAGALTVRGTVEGVGPDTRIAGFVVSPFGQPLVELASVPVAGGRFALELPATLPPARAQVALTPQNVSWPGVIDPVTVSAGVQAAELKFFAYRDANANGHRDDQEPLREVPPVVGSATLFVTWVSGDVTVTASRGYQAALKRGWNALLVDVGRAVAVRSFDDDEVVTVRMRR